MCLSKGETHAILALSGNIRLLKLLLIAMGNGLLNTFAHSFISFGGILSRPVDFLLSIFLKSCSTLQAENFGKCLFAAVRFFVIVIYFIFVIFFYSFDTFMVSKRITNYFYCFFILPDDLHLSKT